MHDDYFKTHDDFVPHSARSTVIDVNSSITQNQIQCKQIFCGCTTPTLLRSPTVVVNAEICHISNDRIDLT